MKIGLLDAIKTKPKASAKSRGQSQRGKTAAEKTSEPATEGSPEALALLMQQVCAQRHGISSTLSSLSLRDSLVYLANRVLHRMPTASPVLRLPPCVPLVPAWQLELMPVATALSSCPVMTQPPWPQSNFGKALKEEATKLRAALDTLQNTFATVSFDKFKQAVSGEPWDGLGASCPSSCIAQTDGRLAQ